MEHDGSRKLRVPLRVLPSTLHPMYRAILIGLLLITPAFAQAPATQPVQPPATQPAFATDLVVTDHMLALPEDQLTYRATAGRMPLTSDEGKTRADVFFVAYERTGEAIDRRQRPVIFVFNGGPGAASVWLHLGTAGPKVLDLPQDGSAPPPPYKLTDNLTTWLTFADLVFIDPVGTGFSRPAEGQDPDQFYGVQEDILAVGEFIRLYITRYQRWASPKFLAGESYGTTRAAGLSEHLLDHHGIALNGIVLISSVLDFATISPNAHRDLPYVLFLPTLVAVAHHHGRLVEDLQQRNLDDLLAEVRNWAIDTYLLALSHGASLDEQRRTAILKQLMRYTGLDERYVRLANLRINQWGFMNQLQADEQRVIGRFDARLTGFEATPLDDSPSHDPSLARFLPVYTSTFGDYVRSELAYASDLKYEVLSRRVFPWNYGKSSGYTNLATELSRAMVKNPAMQVMFASGYHDLATPFFATDYTINHLELDDSLRRNITHRYYTGGHMMYHIPTVRDQLNRDIERFVLRAIPNDPDR